MPMLVKTIDQIARDNQRDVLWVRFHDFHHPAMDESGMPARIQWATDVRIQVLEFLERNGITHQYCYPWFPDGVLVWPYEGDLYMDVPWNPGHADFRNLSAYLEKDAAATPAIEGAWLCRYSLKEAMKYAYRNEPGWLDNP